MDTARAYAAGDLTNAADLLDRIGSLPDAAEARLRAAEQLAFEGRGEESRREVDKAFAFYRSVRATRYEREGELVLSDSGRRHGAA